MAGEQPLGLLVTVGPAAEEIGRAAAARLSSQKIVAFETTADAAEKLPAFLEHGDVVLVKGSRAMEMEKIVDALNRH